MHLRQANENYRFFQKKTHTPLHNFNESKLIASVNNCKGYEYDCCDVIGTDQDNVLQAEFHGHSSSKGDTN